MKIANHFTHAKLNYLVIVLSFYTSMVHSQTSLRSHVKIKSITGGTQIKKIVKGSCAKTIPANHEIKTEFTFKNGTQTYSATSVTAPAVTSYTLPQEKAITIDMPISGKANITKDEADKTILHVDFWLATRKAIRRNTSIIYETRSFDCQGNPTALLRPARVLAGDTICYLDTVSATSPRRTERWFTHAETIIQVLTPAGAVAYYLVDKWDREGDYRLQLRNREYISYFSYSFDLGPIVIPFKFRPSVKRNSKSVGEDISSDLNIGVFAGPTWGNYRMRRQGQEYKDISSWKFTMGGFLNLGTITLDTTATSVSDAPLGGKDKAPIFVVSPGVGLSASYYDINVGLFLGWDIGIGAYAERWNYYKKPWIGLGFGYNLSNFWKKK